MKQMSLKLSRIGNSRGVRLPAVVIRRYGFGGGLAAELREEGLLLKASHPGKLSWEDTARAMAASAESWEDWVELADGQDECPWSEADALRNEKPAQRNAALKLVEKQASRRSSRR